MVLCYAFGVVVAMCAQAGTVYSTDFTNPATVAGGVTANWSNNSTTTHVKGENWLGRFGNQAVTLTLSGLSVNTGTITFDLHIADSWDGDCGGVGPDSVSFSFGSGTTSHTYANNLGCSQNFPNPGAAATSGKTGSYGSPGSFGFGLISFYTFTLPYTATAGQATFQFTGAGLQDLNEESWGIDNVVVNADHVASAVPEPSTWALGCLGLAALSARRIRNR